MNAKLTWLALLVFPAAFACHCPCGKTVCQVENQLFRVDQIQYGASVRTVSWLCGGCGDVVAPYAVIGGQPVSTLTSDYDFQIYQLTSAEKLLFITNGVHGGYVLASDWCCIDSVPYVAVAGTANTEGYEVEIFRLNNDDTLTRVAYFAHGATINAISWLCQCGGNGYLAIGGEPAAEDTVDTRVLLVPVLTTTEQELTVAADVVHGGNVYALDWCTSLTCPLLAVGGAISSIECGVNVRVYSLNCANGNLFPYAQAQYASGTVNTLKWCCGTASCFNNPLLAVGGTRTVMSEPNIVVYYLSSITNALREFVSTASNAQLNINAIDWNPACKCANITAGGGCVGGADACVNNIFVYNIGVPRMLNLITQQQFDTTITSLAWCQPIGQLCTFLLVGAEPPAALSEEPDVNCAHRGFEVALYKGLFCRQVPSPVLPVCNRS